MLLELDSPFAYSMELGVYPTAGAEATTAFAPCHHEDVTADLADLVEEAFVCGVLAGRIDPEADSLTVSVRPVWALEPVADRIRIEVSSTGDSPCFALEFKQGRWTRRVDALLRRLREETILGKDQQAYVRVVALRASAAPDRVPTLPVFHAPEIADQELSELGVRTVCDGELDPDRPILVNQRVVDEILEQTIAAGPSETGGGMLGKIVRLVEPLAGARSRIVTVLTTGIPDNRHEGAPGRLSFSADALVDAAQIAELRGKGESVLTAYHSHGWGTGCDECNSSAACLLPSVELVSADDYQVLETLFPGKASLLPIAGRKLGAPGKRPVLEIHAWSGGAMQPVAFRTYTD